LVVLENAVVRRARLGIVRRYLDTEPNKGVPSTISRRAGKLAFIDAVRNANWNANFFASLYRSVIEIQKTPRN